MRPGPRITIRMDTPPVRAARAPSSCAARDSAARDARPSRRAPRSSFSAHVPSIACRDPLRHRHPVLARGHHGARLLGRRGAHRARPAARRRGHAGVLGLDAASRGLAAAAADGPRPHRRDGRRGGVQPGPGDVPLSAAAASRSTCRPATPCSTRRSSSSCEGPGCTSARTCWRRCSSWCASRTRWAGTWSHAIATGSAASACSRCSGW